MVCDSGTEINRAYAVTWTNGTDTIEVDIGITPGSIGTPFFEGLDIPTGINWTNAESNLQELI